MCLCCFLTLTLVILTPIMITKILPKVAQGAATHSTIVLESAMMSNGHGNSIDMEARLVVHDAGMLSGTIDSVEATVHDPQGREMGFIRFPQLDIVANLPLSIDMTSAFECTNTTVFQESVAKMISGEDQGWGMSAETTVTTKSPVHMTFKVFMNKTLLLPGLKMINPIVSNTRVVRVDPEHAYALADLSFYTVSPITLKGPEWAAFNVKDLNGNLLGISNISYLNISQGANLVKDVPMTLSKSEFLGPVMATYLGGNDQKLSMEGPFASSAPLLNNIMIQEMTMSGSPTEAAIAGLIDDHMLGGWKNSDGKQVRGARAAMYNSLDLPIVITNLVTNLYFSEWMPQIELDTSLLSPSKYTCEPSNMYSKLYYGKGMYENKTGWEYVIMEPHKPTDFFVLGAPMEGQNAGQASTCKTHLGIEVFEHSCCFLATQIAAACREWQRGSQFVRAWMDTNLTATLYNKIEDFHNDPSSGFALDIIYHQPKFNVFFAYQIANGFLSDADLKCSNLKFGPPVPSPPEHLSRQPAVPHHNEL